VGRNGMPAPDEDPEDARDGEESGTLDDRDEVEGRAQTLSDNDQTLSDRDQTLSDRDQQASDEDQAAADLDRDHGGDRDAHAETTARRAARTQERDDVSALRDLTAQERDSAAIRRDAIALLHDDVAESHDRQAAAADSHDAAADDRAQEIEEVRARARAGRVRAAQDRKRALRDRDKAAHDRRRAAQDREQTAYDRRHAGTDELTGARRRGVGIEELQSEMERARRQGDSLVAAYVDVDGLKAVNDRQGHVAGDRLLRSVADGLRSRMRSYDLLMRLGGDEFLCVLPGVSAAAARQRFHDLGPTGPGPWSISLGVSELRANDEAQQLIDRADRDLIEARGRR
jgi:diguanylate cyclase (GGDEF)-like protein